MGTPDTLQRRNGDGPVTGTQAAAPAAGGDETPPVEAQAKSYRYLRITMIGLLLALAAAVFYQSIRQDSVLASVSAYYYTPARSVFVGALIGLGACMIALQGMDNAEDTFLNLGGVFAIVVAIVPTGRGADFDTAVRACQQAGGAFLTQPASKNLACPTVLALQNATKADVENNMATLLVVGILALSLAGIMLFRNRTAWEETVQRPWVLAGFFAAVLLWGGGLAALVASVDWLAANGHYIAAGGLLACVLGVAVANALSRQENLYKWVAIGMVIVSVGFILPWLFGAISLFLVEMVVAFLFVVFWGVQTAEIEVAARRSAAR